MKLRTNFGSRAMGTIAAFASLLATAGMTQTATAGGDVRYGGLVHTALGTALLSEDAAGRLVVENLGSSGQDGVRVSLGDSGGLDVHVETSVPDASGAILSAAKIGTLFGAAEETLTTLEIFMQGGRETYAPDFTPLGASTYTVEAYNDGALVAELSGLSGPAVEITASAGLFGNLFKRKKATPPCPKWNRAFPDGDVEMFVPGGNPILIDEIVWIPDGFGGIEGSCGVDAITATTFQASGISTMWLSEERLAVFAHEQEALGDAEFDAVGGTLVVSNIGSSGQDGVRVHLDESQSFSTEWDASPVTPAGSYLEFSSTGRLSGAPVAPLGTLRVTTTIESIESAVTVDYSPVGSNTHQVQVLDDGEIVFQLSGHQGALVAVPRCEVNFDWRPRCCQKGQAFIDGQPTACYAVGWSDDIEFQIFDNGAPVGNPVVGDQLRVLAENPNGSFESIHSLSILSSNQGPFTITSQNSVPLSETSGVESGDVAASPNLGLVVSQNPVRSGQSAGIHFVTESDGPVEFSVHDSQGRTIERTRRSARSGGHVRYFDGTDQYGRSLPGGVYFVRVRTETAADSERIVLVR